MYDKLGNSRLDELAAAHVILTFASGVVAAPPSRECAGEDAPETFDRDVTSIAEQIARLELTLSTLCSLAYGLEQSDGRPWGKLAEKLRRAFPDLSDLHFAAVALATVEAVRDVAMTIPARNHIDSSVRLKIFAMGLGVPPERREAVRALLVHDIDVLLGG